MQFNSESLYQFAFLFCWLFWIVSQNIDIKYQSIIYCGQQDKWLDACLMIEELALWPEGVCLVIRGVSLVVAGYLLLGVFASWYGVQVSSVILVSNAVV